MYRIGLPAGDKETKRFSLEIDECARLLACAWWADNSKVQMNRTGHLNPTTRQHQKLGPRAVRYMFPLLATFLLTGGRLREVFTLTWGHVDFEGNEITLIQTKSGDAHGTRTMPLWLQLRLILEDHRSRAERTGPGALVFPSSVTGEPLRDVRAALNELKARAGIDERVTPHFFRHTYASIRCQTQDQGAAVASITVAHELGHQGLDQFEKVYGHLLKNPRRLPEVRYPLTAEDAELSRVDPPFTDVTDTGPA